MARKHTSRMTITSSEISAAIKEQLNNYREDVTGVVREAVTDTLRDGLWEIGPAGQYQDRTGKYRQSFRIDTTITLVYAGGTLYADERGYRLAHLLEYGHRTRNGGKTRAFPHWRPVEKKMTNAFEERVIDGIEKLGG